MVSLILAASVTTLATGLGAIPVILMGTRAQTLRPLLMASAAGVMIVAAILGLIAPALERGSVLQVGGGILVGVIFLLAVRRLIEGRERLVHGTATGSTALLVFLVLFVHSLPEGFAIGTAYATDPATLGLFIVLAISLQNIPEGTSVAIPLAANGASPLRQVSAAILSSIPQPVGAVISYLLIEQISGLLPISFGFAAGAMLALAFIEMMPQAVDENPKLAYVGLLAGAAVMAVLDVLIQV